MLGIRRYLRSHTGESKEAENLKIAKMEVNAVTDKLEVLGRFKDKVDKIDEFVTELKTFDVTLKAIDAWMTGADKELDTIKTASDKMTPEDRVSYTMELTEDVSEKYDTIKKCVAAEAVLLPQGDTVKLRLIIMYFKKMIQMLFSIRYPKTLKTTRLS